MCCGHDADGRDVYGNPVCTKCAGIHPGYNKILAKARMPEFQYEDIILPSGSRIFVSGR